MLLKAVGLLPVILTMLIAPVRGGFITLDLPQGRTTGVSADGSVVIGLVPSASPGGGSYAYRWTASGDVTRLAQLDTANPLGAPRSLSVDGSTIVGEQAGGVVLDAFGRKLTGMQAVRWTAGGIQPLVSIGATSAPAAFESQATAISADGSVIAGYYNRQNLSTWLTQGIPVRLDNPLDPANPIIYPTGAFVWTAATGAIPLGDLRGSAPPTPPYSLAKAISADGTTIVGRTANANSVMIPFRWTQASGMVPLGPGNPAINGEACVVSPDGSMIFGRAAYGTALFRWTLADGITYIPALPLGGDASISEITGMTADGTRIVGSAGLADAGFSAWEWDQTHGFRKMSDVLHDDFGIDMGGFHPTWASGISADGSTIVGAGSFSDGVQVPFIATLPEPASFSVMGLAMVACCLARRRG